MLATLGGAWPIGSTPGSLALLAQRWSTSVASWPAGVAHHALRTHAVVFMATWAALFALGLRSHAVRKGAERRP